MMLELLTQLARHFAQWHPVIINIGQAMPAGWSQLGSIQAGSAGAAIATGRPVLGSMAGAPASGTGGLGIAGGVGWAMAANTETSKMHTTAEVGNCSLDFMVRSGLNFPFTQH